MENQAAGRPPKSWLIESILVTLFCCLPLGIVGIINATRVESRFYAGDIAGANQASADAGKWTKIGFFVGIGVNILFILLYIFVIGASVMGAMG
ncbi:MAG: CD225/dispanin family protein [Cyclobacteriaceae bacterium]|nr:CD225/dispanin family protein [Cyclobacteriaceae bacterium]